MAKYKKRQISQPVKIEKKFPSNYGSHASMVNDIFTQKLNFEGYSVLEDERGFYGTENCRLDSGIMDNRRMSSVENRKAFLNAHGLDDISEVNQDSPASE